MAPRITVKLNKRGVAELLTSKDAQNLIMGRAFAVQIDAGVDGHNVRNATTNRARAIVMTSNKAAAEAEATNHTLTKAINAARG